MLVHGPRGSGQLPPGISGQALIGVDPQTIGAGDCHLQEAGECAILLSVPRDQAAAMEILRLGLSLVDGTWPGGASVSTEAVCFS